jgi:hypothetical protein
LESENSDNEYITTRQVRKGIKTKIGKDTAIESSTSIQIEDYKFVSAEYDKDLMSIDKSCSSDFKMKLRFLEAQGN